MPWKTGSTVSWTIKGLFRQQIWAHEPCQWSKLWLNSLIHTRWACMPQFGRWGATGVASGLKFSPCSREPKPAGSKMDPPLAKAKPISKVIALWGKQIQKGKINYYIMATVDTERRENMWERQPCRHQSQRRRWGRRCFRYRSRDSLATHGGLQDTRDPPGTWGERHTRGGGYPKETVTL